MEMKLFNTLKSKCKDMGLTDDELQKIADQFGDGLTDQTTDEEFEKITNRGVETAKIMQSVATRWVNTNSKKKPEDKSKEDEVNGEQGDKGGKPEWFINWEKEQIAKSEIRAKEQSEKDSHTASVIKHTKALQIPEWRMKGVVIPSHLDDASIEAFLTDIKQDLVTYKLMPADAVGIKSASEKAVGEAAIDLLSEVEVK